ncbi:hypothetical protein KAH02_04960 [bacterium]|nr:hypothetical protein [bacterium]
MGCPNLRPLAFTVLNSELLLEQGANEYINHPRGTKKEEKLRLSKIFEWYQDDFGGNETGVLIHQQKYVKGDWANSLNEDELGIEYHYDWRLNESGP